MDRDPIELLYAGSLSEFVREASVLPDLEPEEETRLAARLAEGDPEAVAALIRWNLRMIIDEAIRNRGLGRRQSDLMKAGVEELSRSARRYSPPRHGSFARYARRAVREAMRQTLDAR